jgi:ATPase subunit of ABC transporter with duplicated ATPase domains
VHCPQTADTIDNNTAVLSGAWDGEAQAILGRLGLERPELDRWPTLSPGERKRWQIGGALYRNPDVLLLDEPTNHLDAEARDLLIGALERYHGVGLVVSHDRTVLNRLCTRVMRVDGGAVELWNGGYDAARAGWVSREAELLDSYEHVVAERKKVSRRLADKRRTGGTREAQHKRRLRTAGVKDKDARSMEKKGRFAGGQRKGSRDIALLREEVDRLDEAAASFDLRRALGGDLYFDHETPRRSRLLAFAGALEAGDEVLADGVDVVVERGARIRLSGPNGVGKSTLLRALLDNSTLPAGRVLYLPQELTQQETLRLLDDVTTLDPDSRGRVLGIVGVLGSDPKRVLATDVPSPGEARKLLIATGLGTSAWVLLLDEPTNHLDLPSIERLERALDVYPGAMVVVTHDEGFAAGLTDVVWNIADGGLRIT